MTAGRHTRAPLPIGLSFLILFLFAPLSAARAADFPVDELDAFIKQGLKEYGVPGCSVAVIKDDKVVLMRGCGVRRSGRDEAVDENTLFMIASNTKPFTAAVLATLVDEGKLGWDEHVIDRLPEFVLPTLTRRARRRFAIYSPTALGCLPSRETISSGSASIDRKSCGEFATSSRRIVSERRPVIRTRGIWRRACWRRAWGTQVGKIW